MMLAVMAITMASCNDYDSHYYYDTPPYYDDIVGGWASSFGRDAMGDFELYGTDVVYYDFYSNGTGRYTYYDTYYLEWAYIGFDWYTRRDLLYIDYYDGQYETLYYDFDRYGYLILATDRYFYEYVAYRPSNGYYYAPAKTQEDDSTATTGDLVTKSESNVKFKSLSRAIKARAVE